MKYANTQSIYYESVYKPNEAENCLLSEIIGFIKSDDAVAVVTEIRNEQSAKKRSRSKNNLPAFIPALNISRGDERIATGVIQFDIDKKENLDVDLDELKSVITKLPECIYAFTSVSGGLKFALMTDFKETSLDKGILKGRYKQAYYKSLQYVILNARTHFVPDNSMDSVWQKCFYSGDSNAYLNLDCESLAINDDCIYSPPPVRESVTATADYEYIAKLLEYIPRNISYKDRHPYNCAVLSSLGRDGISLLQNHWDTDHPAKLKESLERLVDTHVFGSVGFLVNKAKEYGYKDIEGAARHNITAKPSSTILPKLLSPEECSIQLTEIVRDFFRTGRDAFINVSTGAGKSKTVLDVLAREIPHNKRVLFLVPRHDLAEEIVAKFRVSRANPIADAVEDEYKKLYKTRNRMMETFHISMRMRNRKYTDIIHLKGRAEACRFNWAKKTFGDGIPQWFCSSCCPESTDCQYIEQFENYRDNIRLMTHDEWFNHQSAWFGGRQLIEYYNVSDKFVGDYEQFHLYEKVVPRKGRIWRPDYIVIDENIFRDKPNERTSDNGEKHASIKKVIQLVSAGMELSDAILQCEGDVYLDSKLQKRPSYPAHYNFIDSRKFTIQEYKEDIARYKREMKKFFSEILNRLEQYCDTRDPIYLQGLWVFEGIMHLLPIRSAADRYCGVPTLFLDATANEKVIRKLLPDVAFHSLSVRYSDDINVYQLENGLVKNADVNTEDGRQSLISWIQKILNRKDYSSIGLITYMNADGIEGNFDEYLASQLGISKFGHFGAITGSDEFEDVDCLLIVGRRFIDIESTRDLACAIFNEGHQYTSAYTDQLVRMKDGSAFTLNSMSPANQYDAAVYEHFSLSETKQALGRGRLIHGKPKEVYLFSNESLGLDVEVTGFFHQNYLASTCPDDAVQYIQQMGYVRNSQSSLIEAGFNPADVHSRRDRIIQELADSNIKLFFCKMKDTKYRISIDEYFIYDASKFVSGAKIDKKVFVEFEPYPNPNK